MAVDQNNTAARPFGSAFGAGRQGLLSGVASNQQAAPQELPKAEYWLNVGYEVDYPLEDGTTEKRFVSLPTGIPLDNQKTLATNSRNAVFGQFQAARNGLYEEIMTLAQGLNPGEEVKLELSVQVRRVNAEAAEVSSVNNSFARPLKLVG